MTFRKKILIWAYALFPFSLKGDAGEFSADDGCDVSCIINFYGRIDLLEGILSSLAGQDMPQSGFEVILVEDRGGTERGREVAERYSRVLNVKYHALSENYGMMGYSRNVGLLKATGKYVLFLDDDTVILQANFLSTLEREFKSNYVDGIIPLGNASYCLLKGKYSYLDSYFPANRCMAYRRQTLSDLGGFISSIIGQEDVEFFIRFLLAGKSSLPSPLLTYFHPPLIMPTFHKPKAVGNSFYRLRSRYPLALWIMLIINCARHAPLYLIPIRKFREMGRFGIGFLAGVVLSPFKKEGFRYS